MQQKIADFINPKADKPIQKNLFSVKDDVVVEEPVPTRSYRWVFRFILLLLFSLVAFGVIVALYLANYIKAFESVANIQVKDLAKEVQLGWNTNPFQNREQFTILVLGLDEIETQREGAQLTDTIMLVSLSPDGKANMLPIPRDLWINSLKTKINALYYYGQLNKDTTGVALVSEVVEEITGLRLDETMVVKLKTLKALIDAMDGVTIDVERSFTDEKFPRDDVDVKTVSDPELLYETVQFEQGKQRMNGETALKFIRSRNSTDEIEGTDIARSKRQQKVLQAVMSQLVDFQLASDPQSLGKLYLLWKNEIETSLTEADIVSLITHTKIQQLDFEQLSIPVKDDESEGIIVNPPVVKYQQWVYEPVDPTWKEFKDWVQEYL